MKTIMFLLCEYWLFMVVSFEFLFCFLIDTSCPGESAWFGLVRLGSAWFGSAHQPPLTNHRSPTTAHQPPLNNHRSTTWPLGKNRRGNNCSCSVLNCAPETRFPFLTFHSPLSALRVSGASAPLSHRALCHRALCP